MEVRKTTRVRRLLQAVRYDLRPDIPSVPCDAEGNPRVTSFVVSLYKTVGDNVPLLHRTTKLRYRRKESSGRWTAWVDKQDSEAITVPTGLYVQYEIEAYYGGALLTSLGVSTTLDGGMGNKGAQSRVRVWSPNDSYMQGQGTEIWYDISLYREDDTKPYEKYLCLISHGPRNITPKDDVAQGLGYWAVATEYEFIATRLMLAERIKANQIDADGITAKDVDIEGKVNATSGTFNGKVTSSKDGTRVEIDPDDNSIRLYDKDNKLCVSIRFTDSGVGGINHSQIDVVEYETNTGQPHFRAVLAGRAIAINNKFGESILLSPGLFRMTNASQTVEATLDSISIENNRKGVGMHASGFVADDGSVGKTEDLFLSKDEFGRKKYAIFRNGIYLGTKYTK